jgi:hypothetical protein
MAHHAVNCTGEFSEERKKKREIKQCKFHYANIQNFDKIQAEEEFWMC